MDKIFIALFNDSLGGAEQYLKMIAEYHLERSHEVYATFLTKKRAGGWTELESYENFYPTYGTSTSKIKGMISLIKNTIQHKKQPAKITFTSHVHLNGTIGLLRYLGFHKTKYHVARESTSIFTRYTGPKLWLFKTQYVLGYKKMDLLICQSHFMKDQLLKNLPSLKSKMKVVVFNNPINLEKIKGQGELSETTLDTTYKYIVSAGRLIPEKGFDLLISAFSELKKTNERLRLIILGEGQLRPQLEEQINNLNLSEDIILEGFVNNVFPYFKQAEVCVVSSRIEGFPNVLLQMMSQNPKVVSTLCAGGIDTIEGIYTVETEDAKALEKTIITALNNEVNGISELFNKELQNRSISSFVSKVYAELRIE